LRDDGAATTKLLVQGVHPVDVDVDVPFEGAAGAAGRLAAPNLEVDPRARALHDGVDLTGLVGARLKYTVWLEREAEDVAVVLSRLPDVADAEDRRCLPGLVAHDVLLGPGLPASRVAGPVSLAAR
jgi:hypothetical protein